MHGFCCEALLASSILGSGSASVPGLRSCTRLFWGNFVGTLSMIRLATQVLRACPVDAQASYSASMASVVPFIRTFCK